MKAKPITEMVVCTKCGEEKPRSLFFKRSAAKNVALSDERLIKNLIKRNEELRNDCIKTASDRDRAEAELTTLKEKGKGICVWKYDDIDDYYTSGCGQTFYLSEGTLKENNMYYCNNCGQAIKQFAEVKHEV